MEYVLSSMNPCGCGSERAAHRCCARYFDEENGDRRTWKSLVFKLLSLYLKASNHAALLLPNNKGKARKREQDEEDDERKYAWRFCQAAFRLCHTHRIDKEYN